MNEWDLKALKGVIDDWKITWKEADIIARHLEEIELWAQEWLRMIAENMLENGFETKNARSYESFAKIMAKTGVKLPSWNELLRSAEVSDKQRNGVWELIDDPDFWGIIVKAGEIQIRYDRFGLANTYITKIDNSWNIISWNWQWRWWDTNDTQEYAFIDDNLNPQMQDLIAQAERLEQTQLAQEWNEKVEKTKKILDDLANDYNIEIREQNGSYIILFDRKEVTLKWNIDKLKDFVENNIPLIRRLERNYDVEIYIDSNNTWITYKLFEKTSDWKLKSPSIITEKLDKITQYLRWLSTKWQETEETKKTEETDVVADEEKKEGEESTSTQTETQKEAKQPETKEKKIKESDILFANKKEDYLPWSAYEKGYTHRLTKQEVIWLLSKWWYDSVKDYQKKKWLKPDGIIWWKTYLVMIKDLNTQSNSSEIKEKKIKESDILFANKKEDYLPWSAYEKGYTHRLTKQEVIWLLSKWWYDNVKDYQKKKWLKLDGVIWWKTYLAMIKDLKIEK